MNLPDNIPEERIRDASMSALVIGVLFVLIPAIIIALAA